jgi:stage III sporulation protein AB
MAEHIRLGNLEILCIIEKCFDKELVFVRENRICVNKEILDAESIKIIEEFFCSIGTGDKKREYERTSVYKNMLEQEYNHAYKVYKEQGRLYNTLGLLCGLFLILFLV